VKRFGFAVKNLPAVLAELKVKGVKIAFEMRDNPTNQEVHDESGQEADIHSRNG